MEPALSTSGWLLVAVALAGDPTSVRVPGGSYEPAYGLPGVAVAVAPFELDTAPVTNAEFLAFVAGRPEWRRGAVPPLFAERTYLEHWDGPLDLGPGAPPDAPVTSVSWFAATAYCEARGARLPTLDEWEFAARASETEVDGTGDAAFQQRVLDWYAVPTATPLPDVRSTFRNVHGVWDLHGLVWEWVLDAQSVMITGESRKDAAGDPDLTCGGGALRSADPAAYAAYLRYAMRAGLRGRYTLRGLGFRCAGDAR